MANNLELFKKLKAMSGNKYLTDGVKLTCLYEANGCENLTQFVPLFHSECKDQALFDSMLERASKGEPIQYITGKCQFLDWVYNVSPDVLIPRVETEQLIANVFKYLEKEKDKKYVVADLCTGSGCIAVSMKNRFPNYEVIATDISEKALEVAKGNAAKYNAKVEFFQGDLYQPLIDNNKKIDILICNPPYIPTEDTIDEQVLKYEPHLALMANPAWKFYERIFQYYKFFMADKFTMFFEIGEDMEQDLINIMNINMEGVAFVFKKDNYGKTRYLVVSGDKNAKPAIES